MIKTVEQYKVGSMRSFKSLDWFMRACLVIVLFCQCKCFVTKNVSFSKRFIAQKISSFPCRKAANCQALHMSSASADKSKYKVLYQKVVRPQRPPLLTKKGEVSPEFLGLVVEYLQSYFQVPIDLPIQYEKIVNEGEDAKHSVITISSPLSSDPSATNLDVEVIGIYPDNDSDENSFTFPTMAMVALKKNSSSLSSSQSSMVEGLFQASEKKIMQVLEQGLNDFMDGRIKMKSYDNLSTKNNDPAWELQQYMEDMSKEESTFVGRPKPKCSCCNNDVVIDTTASSTDDKDEKHEKHTKECKKNNKMQQDNDDDQSDYAVKMAAKIAEAKATINAEKQKQQQQESNESSNDFAVQAALKKQLDLKKKESKMKKERKSVTAAAVVSNKETVITPSLEKKSIPSKPAFRVSISKPADFKKKQKVVSQTRNGEQALPPKDSKKSIVAEVVTKTNSDNRNGLKTQGNTDIDDKFKSDTKERKINVSMNGPDFIDETKKEGTFDNLMFAETKNKNNQASKKVKKRMKK